MSAEAHRRRPQAYLRAIGQRHWRCHPYVVDIRPVLAGEVVKRNLVIGDNDHRVTTRDPHGIKANIRGWITTHQILAANQRGALGAPSQPARCEGGRGRAKPFHVVDRARERIAKAMDRSNEPRVPGILT